MFGYNGYHFSHARKKSDAFLKQIKMYNKQRGVRTSEQNCKVKTVINVDSDKYEADKAYSESINSTLNKLFTKDINPTQ